MGIWLVKKGHTMVESRILVCSVFDKLAGRSGKSENDGDAEG